MSIQGSPHILSSSCPQNAGIADAPYCMTLSVDSHNPKLDPRAPEASTLQLRHFYLSFSLYSHDFLFLDLN